MRPKETAGTVNSVDPDQTARISVYTVCFRPVCPKT